MRTTETMKDLNEIFPFDFYLSLNQAISGMNLVIASPAFTFLEDDELKKHESVKDLKHRIILFETMLKPDESYVTKEMFETNYIYKLNDEIPFYKLIPAIDKNHINELYSIGKKSVSEGDDVDALSLNDNLPVDYLTQISVQLFDENENYLIGNDREIPFHCLSAFDERAVIIFSTKDGSNIFANKEFKWLNAYKERVENEMKAEKEFDE